MLSETKDELASARAGASNESEVARQVFVLVAPHRDGSLAEVYAQFNAAAAKKYASLASPDSNVDGHYFTKYRLAIESCRKAVSTDLYG